MIYEIIGIDVIKGGKTIKPYDEYLKRHKIIVQKLSVIREKINNRHKNADIYFMYKTK